MQKPVIHNQPADAQLVPDLWPLEKSPHSSQLLLLSMTQSGLGYPLGQLGSAMPAVSLPNFCAPVACWLKGQCEKQRRH